jgi:hypothetical protein
MSPFIILTVFMFETSNVKCCMFTSNAFHRNNLATVCMDVATLHLF